MNELTMIEMHAAAGGMSVDDLPSMNGLPTMAPSARLLEDLAALALRQEQAGSLLLQHLSD